MAVLRHDATPTSCSPVHHSPGLNWRALGCVGHGCWECCQLVRSASASASRQVRGSLPSACAHGVFIVGMPGFMDGGPYEVATHLS
jgi:hypothetical protein